MAGEIREGITEEEDKSGEKIGREISEIIIKKDGYKRKDK